MKRILIILAATVLVLAGAFTGALLYVKANMGEITRRHLGTEVNYGDVRLHYSPAPSLVITDLEVGRGQAKVKIPHLELALDLAGLFTGRIAFKQVTARNPEMFADLPRPMESEPKTRPQLDLSTLPVEKVSALFVDQGKVVLRRPGLDPVTFSVTLNMDKIENRNGQGIFVHLKQLVVQEMGLRCSGEIALSSFSPLSLKLNASEASLNPSAVKAFLLNFGYLKEDVAGQIPAVETALARGLEVEISPETESLQLGAEELVLDQSTIKGGRFRLSKKGGFEIICAQMKLHMGGIETWVLSNPRAKETVEAYLDKAKLKSIKTAGTVLVSSLELKGSQAETGDLNGSMDIATQDLTLHLVSQDGKEQGFTVGPMEVRVTLEKGKPSVTVSGLQFSSLRGGSGSLKGALSFPYGPGNMDFEGTLRALKVFDAVWDLQANKGKGQGLGLQLALVSPSLDVAAKGEIKGMGHEKGPMEARLDYVRVQRKNTPEGREDKGVQGSDDRPFDLTTIQGREFSLKAFIKQSDMGHLFRMQDVNLHIQSTKDKAIVKGTGRVSEMNLVLSSLLIPPSLITTQVEGKGLNMDLSPFIACFSNDLPVFLAGKVSLTGILFVTGESPQALIESAEGELMATIKDCTIHRLSNLDYRLGFLMDILHAAGISPHGPDSLTLHRGWAKAFIQKGKVILESFSLRGPVLNTWGHGEFSIKEKRLRLSAQVQTALGITKDVSIDRILQKKET